MEKELSIIISNRNDIAMLVVTIRSAIEELQFMKDAAEIIICDNSDPAVYGKLASALPTGYIPDTLKVFRQDFPCLFTARETAAEKAQGKYILCLDSHMLCGRDMIKDLYLFMLEREDDPTLGFAHAPVSWAHQHERSARHDRDMSVNELGDWNTAYSSPQPITWKGMPWICRRHWFLERDKGLNAYGALAEHRLSWGGGDMHIGIKPWLLGFKNWAVPSRPGIHIGPFPKIDQVQDDPNSTTINKNLPERYRLYAASGKGPHTIGFLVSCYVLGGEKMMNRNKQAIIDRFGKFINVDEWWYKAMEFGANEKKWLDERKIMSFEELLEREPWNV